MVNRLSIGTVSATSLYDDPDGKKQARRNELRLRHKLIKKKALEIELMAVSEKCAELELALDLQKLHSHYSDSLPDKLQLLLLSHHGITVTPKQPAPLSLQGTHVNAQGGGRSSKRPKRVYL
uniref:BZIP domain-containing protein n=1 Tax=Ditylenchus dipsaci TaxID=166011 RepID=A0A915EBP0_9BILA